MSFFRGRGGGSWGEASEKRGPGPREVRACMETVIRSLAFPQSPNHTAWRARSWGLISLVVPCSARLQLAARPAPCFFFSCCGSFLSQQETRSKGRLRRSGGRALARAEARPGPLLAACFLLAEEGARARKERAKSKPSGQLQASGARHKEGHQCRASVLAKRCGWAFGGQLGNV